jgi:hypothetical protein
MNSFPPGFLRRIGIAAGVAGVCAIIFGAMAFGGRPTAMDEAKRQIAREMQLWERVHRR